MEIRRIPKLWTAPLGGLLLALGACTTPPAPQPTASGGSSQSYAPPVAKVVAKPPASVTSESAEKKANRSVPPELEEPWGYVLPSDYGVRHDSGGRGAFLAPRYHGKHNGIDLLAPIGTPTFAPCDGKAGSGVSASFGKWVKIVCRVPRELSGGHDVYASLFFCHLSKTEVGSDLAPVHRGQKVGEVGKTGNASGKSIAPHLHLEIVLQDSERKAEAERHSGRDQSDTRAADYFFAALDKRCLKPNQFERQGEGTRRARRADPFLVLSCLGRDKPDYERAPGNLGQSSERWSELYKAKAFDVDRGRDAPL
jgi:murein DD-endopeptidase MepM/ murein hydrolase activator NlpD